VYIIYIYPPLGGILRSIARSYDTFEVMKYLREGEYFAESPKWEGGRVVYELYIIQKNNFLGFQTLPPF
jgi:hypothetical protein